ncbi:RNA-binding protein [Mycolicibacterium tusciae]|uniref:RNA-binding protein n=1 Tax=Mycolicibacterium tusciae TaxID=75922 RepID=A0A1X0JWB1_9MYCO|nr:RNA-binding protein [Mycolicibacterium tusciae]ORB67000.1 RNA-binding protein [Mycolicibacterium tusciae]
MRKTLLCAAAVLFAGGLVNAGTPTADATLCGSVGGRFVDVTGCSDPLSYLNDALPPPPPPPPPPVRSRAAAEAVAPNVDVCASVGRRISVSGCI